MPCASHDLEQRQEEPGSGTGQSGAAGTPRHEMNYTHGRTRRNNERSCACESDTQRQSESDPRGCLLGGGFFLSSGTV